MSTHCSASPGTSMPSQKLCEPTSTDRGRAEALHQRALRLAALHQHGQVIALALERCAQGIADQRNARKVVVSTKVRPPSARASGPPGRRRQTGGAARSASETPAARTAARARHSRTGCRARSVVASSSPAGSVNQRQPVVVAERRRREDPGLRRAAPSARCSMSPDVERRLDQPRLLRRDVDPAHDALGRRPARSDRASATSGRARSSRRAKSGADLARRRRRARHRAGAGTAERFAAPAPSRRSTPRSLQRSFRLPRRSRSGPAREPQIARGMFARPLRDRARASGRAPAAARRPAGRVRSRSPARCRASCRGTARPPRLSWCASSKTRDVDRRQQFGDAAVAQGHVGEEQMVIDDDDVGGHRLAPCAHDVAGTELAGTRCPGSSRASTSPAELRRRSSSPSSFGQVAAARVAAPTLRSSRQRAHRPAVGQARRWRACFSRCRHR